MKYVLNNKIILNTDSEFHLIYDAERGNIIEVNETAFKIASFCQKERTVDDIVSILKEEYTEIPNKIVLEKDINEIINYFKKKHIIRQIS